MFPILALFAALLAASTGNAQPGQKADLIVRNAHIYTLDAGKPRASSVAVKGERILAVGDDLSQLAGPNTKTIDVHGQTIIPGMIDSHVHMQALGALLQSFDLRAVKSVAEVAELVRKAAASKQPGEWIQGSAWDQTNWGGQFPSAADLDRAAPKNPVYLTRIDGHAGWVNHQALAAAGIIKDTADPEGGKIVRDDHGEPTGILIDRAQALVRAKIPAPTPAQVENNIARAAQECARLGLSTVHDAGIGPAELAAYRKLVAEKKLPIRIYAMIGGSGELWKQFSAKGPEIGSHLTVRSIKLMADGAMGSRGAAFWQPYSDDPGNKGLLILSEKQIETVAREAAAKGFQVNTHAIGDRANRTVLDAYAAVLGGNNDKRFRIEHAQVVSLPDFALFAKYNVIASIQSTHATSDMRWASARLGPDRMQGAWATKRFLNAGVKITNGSDTPVENPNPLLGFYAAVTRQDPTGQPPGGFLPDQKLTREEALKSWTLGGAYAAFEEKEKGSLEAGKLADFVVLTTDIMRVPEPDILKAQVWMTVLGGEIVYQQQP